MLARALNNILRKLLKNSQIVRLRLPSLCYHLVTLRQAADEVAVGGSFLAVLAPHKPHGTDKPWGKSPRTFNNRSKWQPGRQVLGLEGS